MRIFIAIVLGLGLASCAMATEQPSTTAARDSTETSSVDRVLDALDARGQGLKSFTADVKLSETDSTTGDATTHTGKVWYQATPDGSARIRVTFDRKEANNRISEDRIEYVLAGATLIDRTYRTKTQVTRQVLKPGEKINLLKLGEGPFPLPIGQKKEEVHRLFEVKKIEPKPDDPAGTVHLQLLPKPETQFERKFKSIDVWVDQNDAMPRRIETLDRNETTIRTTDLSNVQVNPPLTDADFALPKIDPAEWNLMEEQYQD